MGQDDHPERDLSGYMYNQDGERVDMLDPIDDALPMISDKEMGIHMGKGYVLHKRWAAVADTITKNLALTAPSDPAKYLHITFVTPSTTGTLGEIQIQRGASISGGTTISDIPNLNGDSNALASEVIAAYDVTIDTAGELMFSPDAKMFGSGLSQNNKGVGFIQMVDVDLIVQPGDTLVILNTNQAGQQVDYMNIGVFWYEADKGFMPNFR